MANMLVDTRTVVTREHKILDSDLIRLLQLAVPRGSKIVRVTKLSDDILEAPGTMIVTEEPTTIVPETVVLP